MGDDEVESVRAAIDLFFDRLNSHRIELHIYVNNELSIRLVERAGFVFECIQKAFSLKNGK